MNNEGVVTALPGNPYGDYVRALRYSSIEAVPLTDRSRAVQIGSAGYWYVPDDGGWSSEISDWWNTYKVQFTQGVNALASDTGATHGVLGIFSKLFGVPYGVSVALVVVVVLLIAWNVGALVKSAVPKS